MPPPDASVDASVDANLRPDAYVASCPNGIVDTDEECDDGNFNNNDSCLNNCTFATCGDGIVQTGVEVCDDGTNGPGTCCAADCLSHLSCSGGGINFDTGDVVGTVIWNGAPVHTDEFIALFDASNNQVANSKIAAADNGSYVFSNIPPGSYTVQLFEFICENSNTLLGQQPVTITGGSTSAADFDISALTGHVFGTLLLDGGTFHSPNLNFNSLDCSVETNGDSDGTYSLYLLPASYTIAVVDSTSNSTLGSLSFETTIGQATDLGTTAFVTGAISGIATWNGVPIDSSLRINLIDSNHTVLAANYTASDGSYSFPLLAPGDYELDLHEFDCSDDGSLIAKRTVTVTAGDVADASFEIGLIAGEVVGSITLNNTLLNNGLFTFQAGECFANVNGNSDGSFDFFMLPGSYQASVGAINPSSGSLITVGALSFSITSGQTTDLGVTDFTTGTIAGVVTWHGVPVAGANGLATAVLFDSGANKVTQTYLGNDGSYSFPGVVPGNYAVEIFQLYCQDADSLLGQTAVVVAGNDTVTGTLDIAAGAGQLLGNITVNGVALPSPIFSFQTGSCEANVNGNSDGSFVFYLAPGDYNVPIIQQNTSTTVGTLPFSIAAGQSTEYDDIITPSGSNVSIAAVGGIAVTDGLELIFTSVTTSGTTTVFTSSQGPTPPASTVVLGLDGTPRYWQIATSAVFAGSFEVCTKYDPTQVVGAQAALQIVDAENSFTNITSSVNTTTKVICGITTTMSTFAVIDQP